MNLTFDQSAVKFILKAFDHDVQKNGDIWEGQCVFCLKPMNVKNFGGIINWEGTGPRLLCKKNNCLIKASYYIGED